MNPLTGSVFLLLLVGVLWNGPRVLGAQVGLYGPDRYEGFPEMCLMPMDMGHCRAKVKRYYFDVRRMKCSMFYWGGCAGNVNNFKSMEECYDVCAEDFQESPNNAVKPPPNVVASKPPVARSFKNDSKYKSKPEAAGAHTAATTGTPTKNERSNRRIDESVEYEYDE